MALQPRDDPLPTNNKIVRNRHYNRENNEVVELPVAHQSITEFVLLRKSRYITTVTRRMTCALVRFRIPC